MEFDHTIDITLMTVIINIISEIGTLRWYKYASSDGLEGFWPMNMERIVFEGKRFQSHNVPCSSILPENKMLPASSSTEFLKVEIIKSIGI